MIAWTINYPVSLQFTLLLKRLREVILRLLDHHSSAGGEATESGSQDYQEGCKS